MRPRMVALRRRKHNREFLVILDELKERPMFNPLGDQREAKRCLVDAYKI